MLKKIFLQPHIKVYCDCYDISIHEAYFPYRFSVEYGDYNELLEQNLIVQGDFMGNINGEELVL